MKHVLVAVVLIACTPNYTNSQKEPVVTISEGFTKGQAYLDMNANQKRVYARGVMDGLLAAQLFGAPKEKVKWFDDCTNDMTDEQVAAILTKYLRDNPANWHLPMNVLTYNAIRGVCPLTAKP